MSFYRFEVPTGTIDGVNTTFTTSVPYAPGTLAVYLNGQLIPFSSFSETDPGAGDFDITDPDCVPRSGPWGSDTLQAFYRDPAIEDTTIVIEGLVGQIQDVAQGVSGVLNDLAVDGVISAPQAISALVADDSVSGFVEDSPVGVDALVEDC